MPNGCYNDRMGIRKTRKLVWFEASLVSKKYRKTLITKRTDAEWDIDSVSYLYIGHENL